MEIPQTTHRYVAGIVQSRVRSLQRHMVQTMMWSNQRFAELLFELDLARRIGAPVVIPELLEPTT